MKNISKYCIILLLSTYSSVYSQLQYSNNKELQSDNLRLAMEFLGQDYLVYNGVTIAAMQIPNTNTFIIGTNCPNVPLAIRNKDRVISYLTSANKFSDPWNGMPMEIIFVSQVGAGTITSTTTATSLQLPPKAHPNTSLTRQQRVLHVHAEMNILAALTIYVDNFDTADKSDYIINSNRDYCPRCYAYLKYNGFYVTPDMSKVQVFAEVKNNWCPPNYMNSYMFNHHNWNWSNTLNSYTLNYEMIGWDYINNPDSGIGIIDGAGNNIVRFGSVPCPEVRNTDNEIPFEYIEFE